MDAINWCVKVLEKSKKMRKGDAKTIPCPECGEFIQIYKGHKGRIGCECGKCKVRIRQ